MNKKLANTKQARRRCELEQYRNEISIELHCIDYEMARLYINRYRMENK